MASLKHSVTKRKLKTRYKTVLVTEPSKLWFFYGDVKIKVRPHSDNFWLKLHFFVLGFNLISVVKVVTFYKRPVYILAFGVYIPKQLNVSGIQIAQGNVERR